MSLILKHVISANENIYIIKLLKQLLRFFLSIYVLIQSSIYFPGIAHLNQRWAQAQIKEEKERKGRREAIGKGGRLGRGERGITNESGRQKISCLFSMRLLHSAHSQKLWEGSNNYLKSSLFLLCLRSCCSYPAAFSLITGELPADLAGRSRQDVCSANKLKKQIITFRK